MNQSNTELLFKKYEKLFEPEDVRNNPQLSCMCWGFECGDGWFDLVDRALAKLAALPGITTVEQVKEKYGGLRLYLRSTEDAAYTIEDEAEEESLSICEACGKPGKRNDGGWLSVRCDACRGESN